MTRPRKRVADETMKALESWARLIVRDELHGSHRVGGLKSKSGEGLVEVDFSNYPVRPEQRRRAGRGHSEGK